MAKKVFNLVNFMNFLKKVVICLLSLSLLFAKDKALADNKPIVKLAGLFDLSEAGKEWGEAEKNGFLLAIKEFQKKNKRIKVYYRIEDSGYVGAKAVSAFHKLAVIDNTQYLIGPTWETFVSIAPLCKKKKILCIAPSHGGEIFSKKDNPY
ncbi:MAG: hypothetical protein D6780_06955, partial [Candidatus Dadabacteria bacterium]